MNNVIGTPVKFDTMVIGKIIKYDSDTGKAVMEIDSKEWTEKISKRIEYHNVQLSSRGINPESINWNVVGDNKTKIKFSVPITEKKWWQFWK